MMQPQSVRPAGVSYGFTQVQLEVLKSQINAFKTMKQNVSLDAIMVSQCDPKGAVPALAPVQQQPAVAPKPIQPVQMPPQVVVQQQQQQQLLQQQQQLLLAQQRKAAVPKPAVKPALLPLKPGGATPSLIARPGMAAAVTVPSGASHWLCALCTLLHLPDLAAPPAPLPRPS
jgi:hypothetical protein